MADYDADLPRPRIAILDEDLCDPCEQRRPNLAELLTGYLLLLAAAGLTMWLLHALMCYRP